jgi:hypothetical protein
VLHDIVLNSALPVYSILHEYLSLKLARGPIMA